MSKIKLPELFSLGNMSDTKIKKIVNDNPFKNLETAGFCEKVIFFFQLLII